MTKILQKEILSDGSVVYSVTIADRNASIKLDCISEENAVMLMMELGQRTINFNNYQEY